MSTTITNDVVTSNLNTNMTVYFALRYMYGPGSRGLFAPNWDFMSFALLVLGVGSFLFHASMRQTLMLVDDLSMLLVMWSLLQATVVIRQTPAKARLISTGLAIFFPLFSAFYIQSGMIIYQVIAFALGLILVAARTQYLYHWLQPGYPKALSQDWNFRTWKAILICVFGYVLWNIDLEFCAELRQMRAQIGLPWAWLLELHGWWHILTAIGASGFMVVAREVRQYEATREKFA